ncbi:MAG: cupredoxin domain-containing protein [Thermodesulfobacteriota bacterium]
MNKFTVSLFLVFCFLGLFATIPSWEESETTVTIPLGSSVQGCEETNECFIPDFITVKQGDTVIWLNEDTEPHTVVSGNISFGPDGKFASDTINPGESFSVTFDENMAPDAYFYYDSNFWWMQGIILIEESEAVQEIPDETVEDSPPDINETSEDREAGDIPDDKSSEKGGGCLIATAAYGSELSPQVQKLRELRDNSIMKTSSGSQFMSGFNQFYYLFSPVIADWERQNPIFKDTVKILITPLLATLSILPTLDIDSESEMIGYGLGIISLNVAIYVLIPALTLITIKRRLSKKTIKFLAK